MIETPKINLYLGKVTKVKNRQTYEIEVEIKGVGEELPAVPLSRGEMDEPVEGNLVIVMSVDPVYHSVNFYTKLKENDFIGIRSNGKVLDITPDSIVIGSDGSGKTNSDEAHVSSPSLSYVKMDDSGNIEIMASSDKTVTISGNCTINVSGNTSITTSGNTDIKSSGSCTIDSPDVKIPGASITANGKMVAPGSGPFNCLPTCIFSGCNHMGNVAS